MNCLSNSRLNTFSWSGLVLFLLMQASVLNAQTQAGAVPTLVNFAGTVTDAKGAPLSGIVGVTFSLYTERSGGSPLWIETQNVQPDNSGRYQVMLGSTKSQGLPTDLFTSGEARWLSVEVQGQSEQPRVLLLAVPYALKAADADTIGGKPASAFVLATPGAISSANGSGTALNQVVSPASPQTLGGSGHRGLIAGWTGPTTLGDSTIIQNAAGNIGIGTTNPATGILTTVATSSSVLGLSVTGYSPAPDSRMDGYDAMHVFGGTAGTAGRSGIAIVATGGPSNTGGLSGAAIIANGGDADLYSTGGDGIDATGGGTSAEIGGTAGRFIAGNGRYGSGDGIDVTGGDVLPTDGVFSTGGEYAGNFMGSVNISGTLYASVKDFRIDHPLDPENKYLVHSTVESSEMKNIYDGVAQLDANGEATVQLPAWFEALNGDFRYQLTAIGRPGPGLYVSQEISGNRFEIAGGTPGGKVSWQVTGIRHDAYAHAHPLVVEQQKTKWEQGQYVNPELFGAPAEKSIEWARHPVWMKHLQELKQKSPTRAATSAHN